MHEQLHTTIRQAKLHLQRGDAGRALELLEVARVLARDDAELLQQILPDLVRCCYDTGKEDAARQFEEQLRYLRGEPPVADFGASKTEYRTPRRPLPRRVWVWGGAVLFLVIAALGYGIYRLASQRYDSVPTSPKAQVGLLLRVGRYQGEVDQRNVVVEVPLDAGTATVVDPRGFLLTERALVTDDPARTPSAPFTAHPKLSLQRTDLRIIFGPDGKDWCTARIVKAVDGTNLTLLKIDRAFAAAPPTARQIPAVGLAVQVAGFPDAPAALLSPTALADTAAKLNRLLAQADQVTASDWMTPAAYNAVWAPGEVVESSKYLGGVPHLLFTTQANAGYRGAPLLDPVGRVVGIVVANPEVTALPSGPSTSAYAQRAAEFGETLAKILSSL
jgi:hypothetical protein